MDNRIKKTFYIYLLTFVFVSLIFGVSSYSFFMKDYKELELEINQKKVNTFLNKLNKNIQNKINISNDYSKWDDTYEFINNQNETYIHSNFRDGIDTLKDLNIDSIILTDLNNNIIYSKSINPLINSLKFKKLVVEKYKNFSTLNNIVKLNSNIFYLIKSEIMRSDRSGKPNGYLYNIVLITKSNLNENNTIFKKIDILDKQILKEGNSIKLNYLDNIESLTEIDDDNIINIIQFFNHKKEYQFSFKTFDSNSIIKKGHKTIVFYNLLLTLFVLIIFYIL